MKRYLILIGILLCLSVPTQWVGWRLNHQPGLGGSVVIGSWHIYAPWQILVWSVRFQHQIPRSLNEGFLVFVVMLMLAMFAVAGYVRFFKPIPIRQIGKDKWATRKEIEAAGLLTGFGTVIGKYGREFLS